MTDVVGRAPGRGGTAALVVLVALGAVAGLVLRVLVWRSSLGILDGDEAVWGLMAKHVLQGELPSFYWGQAYGGTLEVFLTAPLVGLVGLQTVVIRAVPIALTAVAAAIVWCIGRRTMSSASAVAAAVLFWVAPGYIIWKTLRAHGFYASGLVLACLVLLLALRLAERATRRDVALLGLVLGLGWWQSTQTIGVAVPALAWLLFRRPALLRDTWLLLLGVAVGAAPWITSNLRNDWWSLGGPGGGTVLGHPGAYASHLRLFVNAHVPVELNLREPFSHAWTLPAIVSMAVMVGLYAAFLWLGWRRRRDPISLIVVVALVYPFVYALSDDVWIVDEPRYAVLLSPAIALLLAFPLRTPARAVAGCAVATALSAVVLISVPGPDYVERADGASAPENYAPLVHYLDGHGIDRVFTGYWIAYTLAFKTDERVIGTESEINHLVAHDGTWIPREPDWYRRPAYYRTVAASPRAAIVFGANEPQEPDLRRSLIRAGYVRETVGEFVVYLPAERARSS